MSGQPDSASALRSQSRTDPGWRHPNRRAFMALAGGGALCLLGGGRAEAATPIPFGPSIGQAGWKDWTFRGIAETHYSAAGTGELRIEARQSSSVIYRAIPVAARRSMRASWQWRVDEGVAATDLGRRGGDDRSLALYVVFVDAATADSYGEETPSLSRMMGLSGGRTLIYVWGGSAPAGTLIPSPYLRGRGTSIILRPAGAGGWANESVDLAADHRRAFGTTPERVAAVAVSSDSDDTGAVNIAAIRNLAFG